MPPRDDGQDIIVRCEDCIFGDCVSPADTLTKLFLCYNQTGENYMKVRGEDFSCTDGNMDDGIS